MTTVGTALALAAALAAPGAGTAPSAAGTDSLSGPGDAVPYVSQGPLLCGGASAAMLERFWGARGVHAQDYAHLVSEDAGGIFTGPLARALSERGFQVDTDRGRPGRALERVRSGEPVMALIRSGESRFHYVVLVGVGPRTLAFHDPLHRPGRSMDRERFLERWSASDYWALTARPDPSTTETGRAAWDDGTPASGTGSRSARTPSVVTFPAPWSS